VFHSGEEGDTRGTVAAFAERLAEAGTEGRRRLSRIGELVDDGLAALVAEDWSALGAAMNENQEQLAWFGVSTPALDRLISAARDAGALGAKLTGGGGGGCVVAVIEPDGEEVLRAVREAGFDVVTT
jgi:mevalonate kinase